MKNIIVLLLFLSPILCFSQNIIEVDYVKYYDTNGNYTYRQNTPGMIFQINEQLQTVCYGTNNLMNCMEITKGYTEKDNLYINAGNYLFVITSKSVYLCRPDKIIEIYFRNNVTKDFYRR